MPKASKSPTIFRRHVWHKRVTIGNLNCCHQIHFIEIFSMIMMVSSQSFNVPLISLSLFLFSLLFPQVNLYSPFHVKFLNNDKLDYFIMLILMLI